MPARSASIGVGVFRPTFKAQAARQYKIASNQVRYSLIDRSIERGLLNTASGTRSRSSPSAPGFEFTSLKEADPEGALTQVARISGRTEAQVALNWLIAKDNVGDSQGFPRYPTRSKTARFRAGGSPEQYTA